MMEWRGAGGQRCLRYALYNCGFTRGNIIHGIHTARCSTFSVVWFRSLVELANGFSGIPIHAHFPYIWYVQCQFQVYEWALVCDSAGTFLIVQGALFMLFFATGIYFSSTGDFLEGEENRMYNLNLGELSSLLTHIPY